MDTLLEKGIPTREVNEAARKEKRGRAKPPISELHYWWTRKPLITARAVLLSALSDTLSASALKEMCGLTHNMGKPFEREPWRFQRDFGPLMKRAEELYGHPITIYDPFAGSGMIGFEALRLGLNVVLSDVNPVAYLVMKTTIEYPKKYGEALPNHVKELGKRIMGELKRELSDLYPSHDNMEVKAYIWAWAVKCPKCGRVTPLVNDWRLSEKEYISYTMVGDELRFEVKDGGEAPKGNVERGKAKCLFCNMIITNEEIAEDIRENRREVLLAVVLNGRKFSTDTGKHLEAYRNAAERLRDPDLSQFIPDEDTPTTDPAHVSVTYYPKWSDLFNDRQLLVLASLARKIRMAVEEEAQKDPEYARALGASLAAWLAKHVDYNSRATQWHSANFQIGHSLANRGIGAMWKHAETNPFAKFSGSLQGMLGNVVDALRFSAKKLSGTGKADIRLGSALSKPKEKYRLIVTDPPYYDDVAYGELSEFFYVWERRVIGDLFPEAFSYSHVDVSESIDACGDRSPEMFYSRLEAAFVNLHEALEDDGLLVVFFAHRSLDVWKHVADILSATGFHITSSVPLMTENVDSVLSRGGRKVYYSLILTARKRRGEVKTTRVALIDEIQRSISDRLNDVKDLNYLQGELALWANGVALSVVTKYSEIESFSMESASSTAIEYAQMYTAKVFLREDMKMVVGREISTDSDTNFYLLVLRGGDRSLDYDELNRLVKATGSTEVELFRKGLVTKTGNGKRAVFIVRDALERAGEYEGVDKIRGESKIDWVHRCLASFNVNPGKSVIEDHAKSAGVPLEEFLMLIRMIHYYETASDDLSKNERDLAGRALDVTKQFLDRGKNLDRWFD